MKSSKLCRTTVQRRFLSPDDAETFTICSFFSRDLVLPKKETAGNDSTVRTAAGVGLSAPGVGVSTAEGRGLCG
jgi:hypothetical protein